MTAQQLLGSLALPRSILRQSFNDIAYTPYSDALLAFYPLTPREDAIRFPFHHGW